MLPFVPSGSQEYYIGWHEEIRFLSSIFQHCEYPTRRHGSPLGHPSAKKSDITLGPSLEAKQPLPLALTRICHHRHTRSKDWDVLFVTPLTNFMKTFRSFAFLMLHITFRWHLR